MDARVRWTQLQSERPLRDSVNPDAQTLAVSAVPAAIPVPEKLLGQEPVWLAGMEFVRIPAGVFLMGSNSGNAIDHEHPITRVRISSAFLIGKYEVTQSDWESVMGRNPSHFAGCGRYPVENVTWRSAQRFINRLNKRQSSEGYRFRLPTEAEWEYAARAGNSGAWHASDLDLIAWHRGNSQGQTHPVGRSCPTNSGCTTCWVTCGSSCKTGSASTPAGRRPIRPGPTQAAKCRVGAAAGVGLDGNAGCRIVWVFSAIGTLSTGGFV